MAGGLVKCARAGGGREGAFFNKKGRAVAGPALDSRDCKF